MGTCGPWVGVPPVVAHPSLRWLARPATATLLVLASLPRESAGAYLPRYSYVSPEFFSGWTFLVGKDPTHGTVDYVSRTEAETAGLVQATATRVYMGVDMQALPPAGTGRRSVRVQSRTTYREGLFVVNVEHVPTGCSLWPAFWMYGEDQEHPWPSWGEFDIIEGVHKASRVATTLHTSPGCNQAGVGSSGGGPSVDWNAGQHGLPADDCHVAAAGQWENQGCSQQGPEATMGEAFNADGGGTFAAEWDPEAGHIRTWFWPNGTEPADLMLRQPNPDIWGPPYSYFRLDRRTCDPEHFQNMRLVFDITFCGDLGGPTFASSCPEIAKQGIDCEEFVRRHPEMLQEGYWSVRSLDVYTHGGPEEEEPNPDSWWIWLLRLTSFGALSGVASLYAVVWLKVRKGIEHAAYMSALYEDYERAQNGQPAKLASGACGCAQPVWRRWGQPSTSSWSPLSAQELEEDSAFDDGDPVSGLRRSRPGMPKAGEFVATSRGRSNSRGRSRGRSSSCGSGSRGSSRGVSPAPKAAPLLR